MILALIPVIVGFGLHPNYAGYFVIRLGICRHPVELFDPLQRVFTDECEG